MQAAARARGVEMSALRARKLVPKDFKMFDFIVGMDDKNTQYINALRSNDATTKVVFFQALQAKTDR